MINPLLEVIFEIIITKKVYKVHTLLSELEKKLTLPLLDPQPKQNLFKKNFLIMNALYQLQQQITPNYLRVSAMHIELLNDANMPLIHGNDSLRDYYLNWENYQASTADINELLASFWQKMNNQTLFTNSEHQQVIIHRWQLPAKFTIKELQKRWRKLAIQAHPDKSKGSDDKFKQLKQEYEQLKTCCSN
ncbi:DnaJ domain-containing protein [Pseudoalteromonas sp. MMG010]|uniref:DNA-J related domain-containing protein n=1 Tax=Pseudoalteromonas sp. MMG010 TaxID=2822685 RepID=UPI001B3A35BE|nr:DNA-J related domain-containing protein [Pseudoalteromonas sp. MMG010]MBQ4834120.1 DnaJ domain-containing protein [Pseudoalteromonas sp. MMG010]